MLVQTDERISLLYYRDRVRSTDTVDAVNRGFKGLFRAHCKLGFLNICKQNKCMVRQPVSVFIRKRWEISGLTNAAAMWCS